MIRTYGREVPSGGTSGKVVTRACNVAALRRVQLHGLPPQRDGGGASAPPEGASRDPRGGGLLPEPVCGGPCRRWPHPRLVCEAARSRGRSAPLHPGSFVVAATHPRA